MTLLVQINSLFTFRRKLFFIGLILVIPFVVLEIWSFNRLSTFGEQIAQLEQTKANIKLENQLLLNEISQKEALLNIDAYARHFGFEKVKNIEFVKNISLALKP